MKKIIAISLAGLAAIALTSCTCNACGGSGLQTIQKGATYTTNGRVATAQQTTTIPCVPCRGTGRVRWADEAGAAVSIGNRMLDATSKAKHTF